MRAEYPKAPAAPATIPRAATVSHERPPWMGATLRSSEDRAWYQGVPLGPREGDTVPVSFVKRSEESVQGTQEWLVRRHEKG